MSSKTLKNEIVVIDSKHDEVSGGISVKTFMDRKNESSLDRVTFQSAAFGGDIRGKRLVHISLFLSSSLPL